MLSSGFRAGKRKRMLIVFIILLLVAGAGLFFISNIHHKKHLTFTQQAIVSSNIGTDSCKNLSSINKVNIQSLEPQDAVNVLNYRASCYFDKGEYQNAINEYQKMYAFCSKAPNPPLCNSLPNDSIKSVESVMAAVKSQQSIQKPTNSGVQLP
jgi:uncharacterized protein YxeA